jgi:hypothetical protein
MMGRLSHYQEQFFLVPTYMSLWVKAEKLDLSRTEHAR